MVESHLWSDILHVLWRSFEELDRLDVALQVSSGQNNRVDVHLAVLDCLCDFFDS